MIELHFKVYLQRAGVSVFNVSFLGPNKSSSKHKFPDRPTPITCSPQKGTVHWASSWLRAKTLSINRSLILTPLLRAPIPLIISLSEASAATKGFRRRVRLKINTVWHQQATASVDGEVFTSDAVPLGASESNLLITQPAVPAPSAWECGDITAHLTSARYILAQLAECEQEGVRCVCWCFYQGFSV